MDLISTKFAPSNQEEAKQLIEWSVNGLQNQNYFDPNVLGYPATIKLAAGSKSKNILYMPIQHVLMLESLAANPEASKHEIAVGLRAIVNACQVIGQQAGIGEIYFVGTNDQTNAFAEKHGFVKMPWDFYKIATTFNGVPRNEPTSQDLPQDSNGQPDLGSPSGR